MCKRKYIVFTVAVGAVAICTQVMAQTPADLRAIQEIADKALNAHDLDRWLSYFTDDAVFEWTPAPAPFTGKAEIRAFFESVFTGFPDFGTTEGRVFAAGQVVVVEHSTTGTQRGVWQGIPPTGNSAPMPHVDVYDYEGNRIKHAITYADAGGVMMQLGVMPVPAAPKLIPSFAPPSPEPTGLRPLDAVVEAIARWNTHDLVRYAKMVRSDATFLSPRSGFRWTATVGWAHRNSTSRASPMSAWTSRASWTWERAGSLSKGSLMAHRMAHSSVSHHLVWQHP